jgi:hypothetical protein
MTKQQINGDEGERLVAGEWRKRGWGIEWPPRNHPTYDFWATRDAGERIAVQVKSRVTGKSWNERKDLDPDVLGLEPGDFLVLVVVDQGWPNYWVIPAESLPKLKAAPGRQAERLKPYADAWHLLAE